MAERLINEGARYQNPVYDMQFGVNRNMISVTTMLSGCEELLQSIFPHFRENIEAPDSTGRMRTRTISGENTAKFKYYIETINNIKKYINISQRSGKTSTIGIFYINKAMSTLQSMRYDLRRDVNGLGFDFQKARDPTKAYKEGGQSG
jgi:hypothetical protein